MRPSRPPEGRESRGVVTWDGTGAAPGNACPGPGVARGTRGRGPGRAFQDSSLAPAAGLRPGPGVGVKHRARDAGRLPYKLGSSRRVPRNLDPSAPKARAERIRESDDARLPATRNADPRARSEGAPPRRARRP